jgi:putative transcriptional regulator
MFKPENIENSFFLNIGFNFDPSLLKPGDVLISEPFLSDPNFSRSVVLIAEYKPEEGAFGFIINKPTELEITDIIDELDANGHIFHQGGPVNTETLFFIHNKGDVIPNSHLIMDGLWWSGDYEEVVAMINHGIIGQGDVKFFGGYSGWAVGQLEDEIKSRSWIIGKLGANEILSHVSETLWKTSLNHLGTKFSIMANFPENPELN